MVMNKLNRRNCLEIGIRSLQIRISNLYAVADKRGAHRRHRDSRRREKEEEK
jgi:hypothetical protein